jgi:hypothetical protein
MVAKLAQHSLTQLGNLSIHNRQVFYTVIYVEQVISHFTAAFPFPFTTLIPKELASFAFLEGIGADALLAICARADSDSRLCSGGSMSSAFRLTVTVIGTAVRCTSRPSSR